MMQPIRVAGDYFLRPSIKDDAEAIIQDLRKADLEEWAKSVAGGVPENLLTSVVISAECYTIADWEGNDPQIMFGVVNIRPRPVTWLLGTNRAQQDAWFLMAGSAGFVAEFFKRWPSTVCYSAPENTVHHRWLGWLGYTKARALPWGDHQAEFYEFIREAA